MCGISQGGDVVAAMEHAVKNRKTSLLDKTLFGQPLILFPLLLIVVPASLLGAPALVQRFAPNPELVYEVTAPDAPARLIRNGSIDCDPRLDFIRIARNRPHAGRAVDLRVCVRSAAREGESLIPIAIDPAAAYRFAANDSGDARAYATGLDLGRMLDGTPEDAIGREIGRHYGPFYQGVFAFFAILVFSLVQGVRLAHRKRNGETARPPRRSAAPAPRGTHAPQRRAKRPS